MTTFERMLVEDKASHEEPKNPYYRHYDDPEIMGRVLEEFGIESGQGHIINGHIPVKSKDGESPIKCNGRVLTIDGGFCKAYQNTTGIAGYTLIYNSYGMRLVSHGPFTGIINAVEQNTFSRPPTSSRFPPAEGSCRIPISAPSCAARSAP